MKKTPNSKSATRRVLHLSYAGTPFKPSVGLSGMRKTYPPTRRCVIVEKAHSTRSPICKWATVSPRRLALEGNPTAAYRRSFAGVHLTSAPCPAEQGYGQSLFHRNP